VKKLLTIMVLVGVVLVGGAYWLRRPRTVAVSEELFTYTPVEHGALRETVSATGILKPRDVLLVTSELPGTVVDVLAKVNDLVSDGQVVLKLDDSTLRLKLEEAENAIEEAQTGVGMAKEQERAAKLALKYQQDLEKGGGFRSEKDQAEAKFRAAEMMGKAAEVKVRQARTAKKQAERALEKTEVRVPVLSGSATPAGKRRYLVLDCKVERGQMVGPTLPTPLFTLAADLSAMEVHAQVAEGDIGKVRKGMSATFTVSAYTEGDIKFSGQVSQVRPVPSSQQGAVFYDTVIDVANQHDPQTGQWRLRPGMTAAVDLIRRAQKSAWKMPMAALSFQMDDAYQSDAARARIAEWNRRPDHADWRPVWTWDGARGEAWPIFVRINTDGTPGLSDGQFNEILAWEPGREPSPSGPPLRVIVSAPPPHKPGLFEQPTNIKF
jgi:HlyD family secretion protein